MLAAAAALCCICLGVQLQDKTVDHLCVESSHNTITVVPHINAETDSCELSLRVHTCETASASQELVGWGLTYNIFCAALSARSS